MPQNRLSNLIGKVAYMPGMFLAARLGGAHQMVQPTGSQVFPYHSKMRLASNWYPKGRVLQQDIMSKTTSDV